jgi:putative phage-type endonuclease
MIILDVEQRSPAWFKARCGIPTASSFDKIVTSKGEPSKQAQKYMYQLAGERVTGIAEETYMNATMQQGIDREAEAVEFYELTKDATVQKVGICYKDEEKKFSCSPDGLVGDKGLIEIKCPLISTTVGYLLSDDMPSDYVQQVQGNLFITGREWVDFLAYYPGLRPMMICAMRDEVFIKKLETALIEFCQQIETIVKKIS